jgi:hypothetical protein
MVISPLAVVLDLDLKGVTVFKFETNSQEPIYIYGPLARSATLKRVKLDTLKKWYIL